MRTVLACGKCTCCFSHGTRRRFRRHTARCRRQFRHRTAWRRNAPQDWCRASPRFDAARRATAIAGESIPSSQVSLPVTFPSPHRTVDTQGVPGTAGKVGLETTEGAATIPRDRSCRRHTALRLQWRPCHLHSGTSVQGLPAFGTSVPGLETPQRWPRSRRRELCPVVALLHASDDSVASNCWRGRDAGPPCPSLLLGQRNPGSTKVQSALHPSKAAVFPSSKPSFPSTSPLPHAQI